MTRVGELTGEAHWLTAAAESAHAMLALFAVIFALLSIGLLMLIRPLSRKDLDMIGEVRPGIVRYLKWFARRAD